MKPPPRRDLGPAVGRGSTEPVYRLSCTCGYKVCCEVVSHGDGLAMLVFFDEEEASETRDEQIWSCPGCHSRLSLLSFQP